MAINVGTAVAYLTLDKRPFNNGLKSAGSDLKNFIRGTGEAGGRLKSLGGALTSIGGTLTKTVTLPIVGIGTACTKMASDFETSMAKINTIAGASKKELEGMRKEILKASGEMGIGAKDFGEAVYQALSSGVDKANAVDFTKKSAKLAKGGFTDITVATDTLTSVINAYGKSTEDTTDISNQLIIAQKLGKTTVDEMGRSLGNVVPISSALGVKTNELFSSIAVATAQGQKTAESITGVKAAMSNIVKPSEQAKKAAEALGLQFDVNAVKSKGWMGFLQDVRSKLDSSAPAYAKKMDEVNKLKAAIKSSTDTSKKYKDTIEQEREKISKLREEKKSLTSKDKDRKKAIDAEIKSMQEHIKTMQKQAKAEKDGAGNVREMKKELKAKEKELKILENTSKDTLTAFGTMFGSVEGLNTVMALTSGSGVDLYNKSMKEMKENTNAVQDAYDKMMDTPAEKFKQAKEQLKVLAITIGGYLLPQVVRFLDAFSKVLEIIGKLPEPIKRSIVSFAGMAALAGPIMMLSGNIIKLGGSIFGTLSKLKNISQIISGVAGGTKTTISGLNKAFKGLGKGIGVGIKGTLEVVKGLGRGIGGTIKWIGKGIMSIPNFFAKLPGLITPHTLLVIAAIAGIGFIVYEVIKHWKGFVGAIKKGCAKVTNFFKTSAKGWKIIFGELGKFFGKIGNFMMDGLLGGIVRGAKKVGKKIGEVASNIKNGFKNALGIHSPSRVFTGYGINIGEGLVQGIDKQEGNINTKFKGLANKIKGLGNIRPQFDGLNNLALSGAYGGEFNTGNTNKNMGITQDIKMYITIPNADKEGATKVATEFKNMTQSALKNTMVDMFMNDAMRSY